MSRCRKFDVSGWQAIPMVVAIGTMVCLIGIFAPGSNAQIVSGVATVNNMSGRVSLERAGELWAVSAGQAIQNGQTIVTGSDGFAQLGLPDGSVVEIFPDSRVVYRANQFNLRELLDIYLGKVRLQIQHLLPGETPLRITSPTAVISVRGTEFEVEVDAAQDTTVSVDTGAVGVRHRLIPGEEVLVQSGQSLHVTSTLPLTAKVKSTIPIRAIGRVVQAVSETLAQIHAARGSGRGSASGGASPGGGVSSSDSGSNETKPPANGDGDTSNSGGSGAGTSAPPGDVLP